LKKRSQAGTDINSVAVEAREILCCVHCHQTPSGKISVEADDMLEAIRIGEDPLSTELVHQIREIQRIDSGKLVPGHVSAAVPSST